MSEGADVNTVNEDLKCSPLHHSVLLGSLTATRALLDAGATIHRQELLGETVLHVAATVGNCHLMDLLLSRCDVKRSVDVRDKVTCLCDIFSNLKGKININYTK